MEITVDIPKAFKATREIMFSPKEFFVKSAKQRGWKSAFSFIIVISAVGYFFSGLYNLFVSPLLSSAFPSVFLDIELTTVELLVVLISGYLLTLVVSFVWGAGLKLVLRIFGVSSTFGQSYKISAYSQAPSYLLGWFPGLNLLILFYCFYLLGVAIKHEYGVSSRKAGVIVVASLLIIILPLLILVLAVPHT